MLISWTLINSIFAVQVSFQYQKAGMLTDSCLQTCNWKLSVAAEESNILAFNSAGQLYILEGNNTRSISQTYKFTSVASCGMNSKYQIVGLTRGQILYTGGNFTEWSKLMNGSFLQLDCRGDDLWVIDMEKNVHRIQDDKIENIKGTLDTISVGKESVWGVLEGKPYKYDTVSQTWIPVPGLIQIQSISTGASTLFAINQFGKLYYYNGGNLWTFIDGPVNSVATGGQNLYKVSDSEILKLPLDIVDKYTRTMQSDNTQYGWELTPLSLSQISISNDQTLLAGVDEIGNAYSIDLNTFTSTTLGNTTIRYIAACGKQALYNYWAIDSTGRGIYWSDNRWNIKQNLVDVKQIDCDNTNALWMNQQGTVFKYQTNDQWVNIGWGVSFSSICSSQKRFYGVSKNELFWKSAFDTMGWTPEHQQALDVRAGNENMVIVAPDGNLYNQVAGIWNFIPGNLSQVDVGTDLIFGLDKAGRVWRIDYYTSHTNSLQSLGWTEINHQLEINQIAVSKDETVLVGLNDTGHSFLYNSARNKFLSLGNITFKQVASCGIGAPFIAVAIDSTGNYYLHNSVYWQKFSANLLQVDCDGTGIAGVDSDGIPVLISESVITRDMANIEALTQVRIVNKCIYAVTRDDTSLMYYNGTGWKPVFMIYDNFQTNFISISSSIAISVAGAYNYSYFNYTMLPNTWNTITVGDYNIYGQFYENQLRKFSIAIPTAPSNVPSVSNMIMMPALGFSDPCLNEYAPGPCDVSFSLAQVNLISSKHFNLFEIQYQYDNQCLTYDAFLDIIVAPCGNGTSTQWTIVKFDDYVFLQNLDYNLCIVEIHLEACLPDFRRSIYYADAFKHLPPPPVIDLNGFQMAANGLTGSAPNCKWVGPYGDLIAEANYEYQCVAQCNLYAKNETFKCTSYTFDFNIRKLILNTVDEFVTAQSYNLWQFPNRAVAAITNGDISYSNCDIGGNIYKTLQLIDCRSACQEDSQCKYYKAVKGTCSLFTGQLNWNNVSISGSECGFVVSRNPGCESVNNITTCRLDSQPKQINYNHYTMQMTEIYPNFEFIQGNCTFLEAKPYSIISDQHECSNHCLLDEDCTSFVVDPEKGTCKLYQQQLEYNNFYPTDSSVCGILFRRNSDCSIIDSSLVCKQIPFSFVQNQPSALLANNRKFNLEYSYYYSAEYCYFEGDPITTYEHTYYGQCLDECNSIPECTSFSFNLYNNKCDLFTVPMQSPTVFENYSVILNGERSNFDIAVANDVAYVKGSRYFGNYYQKYVFRKFEECQRICQNTRDCVSFSWVWYGNCWLYQESFELLTPFKEEHWKSGFIVSKAADHCKFDVRTLNCTTTNTPMANLTFSINGTLKSVPMNISKTWFGKSIIGQNFSSTNLLQGDFNSINTTLSNSTTDRPASVQMHAPKPTNSPNSPFVPNTGNYSLPLGFVIAGCVMLIIIAALLGVFIRSKRLENLNEHSLQKQESVELSNNSFYEYTPSGRVKFKSVQSYQSGVNNQLSNGKYNATLKKTPSMSSSEFYTAQSLLQKYSEAQKYNENNPRQFVWSGSTINIYTDITGIEIFEDFVQRFLCPLGEFESQCDYESIHTGDTLEIVLYTKDSVVVRDANNIEILAPFSIIPTINFPMIIVNLLNRVSSETFQTLEKNFSKNLRVNQLDSWSDLDPDSYSQEGIWNSLLEEKSILIHLDNSDSQLVMDYLEKISDTIWTYFDVYKVSEPFDSSLTIDYNPFQDLN
ncbi:hypothetical protein HDV06_004177 [Boothiomyces sp. JEL0866]|nr:hypothetical protein HDV06_004177 [Boothiomyces sp. JEL0866]